MRKYVVKLTNAEEAFVYSVLENEAVKPGIRKRASVLIMLNDSMGEPESYNKIAAECNVAVATVLNVAQQYSEYGLEKTLTRKEHKKAPRMPVITEDIEAKLVALARSAPPPGRSRWSARLLAEKMVELGIVPAISRDTVWRALKRLGIDCA
jgi:transposase